MNWIEEVIENGSCPICNVDFKYYENGIRKHKSLLVLNVGGKGEAYCGPRGEMICERRRNENVYV